MKLITQRTRIREVAERWQQQYAHVAPESSMWAIHRKLLALDVEKATPADVTSIIGNDSWVSLKCHECQSWDVTAVVRVGEIPDYESATACLCLDCLEKAVALAREASE